MTNSKTNQTKNALANQYMQTSGGTTKKQASGALSNPAMLSLFAQCSLMGEYSIKLLPMCIHVRMTARLSGGEFI